MASRYAGHYHWASGGTRSCQSVAFCQAQPMRSAIASSPPRQTICSDSGNPDGVNPLGTASPHRSRKLTQRVKKAGVVL